MPRLDLLALVVNAVSKYLVDTTNDFTDRLQVTWSLYPESGFVQVKDLMPYAWILPID